MFRTLQIFATAASCLAFAGTASAGTPPPSADLIRSDFAPGELTFLCQQAIAKAQTRIDALVKVPVDSRNFDNTVLELENVNADMADEVQPLSFMKYVSPVKATNAEGAKCEQLVGDFKFAADCVRLALRSGSILQAISGRVDLLVLLDLKSDITLRKQ